MTASNTTALAGNGSFNLALLPPADRALMDADKQACLIRWKVRDLKGPEKQRQGNVLLAAVPESARPAVVAALKARAGK
ncbi:hypothetical protein [Pseudomonas songnenensis]|uniref:Uncharacterized protein n=1 Tax=Pseudomonas songnenensis TaxID=1176259 RepID=A0A482U9K5_9PSED|nr:hypothetical protein [Pseudomonas songnenensis]RYJ63231.1 hypothetical protein EJA06_004560 [Pseudomonas songnenensis]